MYTASHYLLASRPRPRVMLQALCDAGQQQMHRPLWWGDIGGTGRSWSSDARDKSRHGGMVSTVNWKEQAADQTAARLRLTKMISDAATRISLLYYNNRFGSRKASRYSPRMQVRSFGLNRVLVSPAVVFMSIRSSTRRCDMQTCSQSAYGICIECRNE
jgi:hypothetical protein